MLTLEQANVVAENLLASERQASAVADRTGRMWSVSFVLVIFAILMCGLIFSAWFFVAHNWIGGWRTLGAMVSVSLPCLYIAVLRRRRRAGRFRQQ